IILTKAGNPVKKILLKLNLSDHRSILTDLQDLLGYYLRKLLLLLRVIEEEVGDELETSMENVEECLWWRGLYGEEGRDVALLTTKRWIVVLVSRLWVKGVRCMRVLDMQVTLHDKRIVMQVTLHYEAIVMQVTLHDKRIVMQVTLHYEAIVMQVTLHGITSYGYWLWIIFSGWSSVSTVLGQMTYPVASLTLDSARSYVMQGASFTQGIVSSIPIGGSICPEVTNAKVAVAKETLKEARTRQKSYADKHRRELEFQPGDHVFLKVSPARGVRRFGIKGKLSPRFIGPFEILDRVGERIQVSSSSCYFISTRSDRTDLSYVEEPKAIFDRQDKVMSKKTIPFVKILWRNHPEREATWETEESIRTSNPYFLP
nr:putative nucleotidyltransferase, ribonuclease H [Tanacetum cinerariifolium]